MESKRSPRRVLVIGVVFAVVALVLGAAAPLFHYNVEWAGVTMLLGLGVAMSLLAYVLISGSSGD
jgi:hypothetical protein